MMLCGAGVVTTAYFGWEFSEIFDQLYKKTDDYYALQDFGYATTKFINPIAMYEIITLPDIWEQVWLQLIIATSVYAVASVGGFILYMPVDIFTTSIYLHFLVWLMKQIELDPKVNLLEIVLLEKQGEFLYAAMLAADIALAISAFTIMGSFMFALVAKYHI